MLSARCQTLSRAGRPSGMQQGAGATGKFRHKARWSLLLDTGHFQPGIGWVRYTEVMGLPHRSHVGTVPPTPACPKW